MTITDAPNTYNNAIEILYQKGYEVFLLDKDEDYLIYMKKNEEVTVANDPLSLLAISYAKEDDVLGTWLVKENGKIVDESWEDKFMDNFSALAIKEILSRKYSIKITDKHSDWYDWIVKKKDEMYFAQTPLRLLALLLLIDYYGWDWYKIAVPSHLNELKSY